MRLYSSAVKHYLGIGLHQFCFPLFQDSSPCPHNCITILADARSGKDGRGWQDSPHLHGLRHGRQPSFRHICTVPGRSRSGGCTFRPSGLLYGRSHPSMAHAQISRNGHTQAGWSHSCFLPGRAFTLGG